MDQAAPKLPLGIPACRSCVTGFLKLLGSSAKTGPPNPIQPFVIAWLTLGGDDGEVWETATVYYNGASDGGKAIPGIVPRTGEHFPSVVVGLEEGFAAACIRQRREAVLHTATWDHRRHLQELLEGQPMKVAADRLRPARGVSVPRIAAAPIALSLRLTHELPLNSGRVAFVLDIVTFRLHRSIVVGGVLDSRALMAVGARDPAGSLLVSTREEHTMVFPSERDGEGRWIVPPSEPTPGRQGAQAYEDLEWEPPVLAPLQHNPFKALIVPRPIGWISTRGRSCDNLSPYSFFAYLSRDVVYYAVGGTHVEGGEKDALRDARATGVFCVNAVPWHLRVAMSATSAEAPHGVDEFELPVAPGHVPEGVRLLKGQCKRIDAPCVGNVPLHLECKVLDLISLGGHTVLVVGQVVHVEGRWDGPVATRGGYFNYFRIAEEHDLLPGSAAALW